MFTIAFWLAIVTLFIPKKYKQICGNISMGILGVLLINWLIDFFFHIRVLPKFLFFGSQLNPIILININFISPLFKTFTFTRITYFIHTLLFFGIYLSIAYASTKVSIIKYKSDKEFEEGDNSETTRDIVSTAADGRLLRVVEVNAGLCTGTLRGAAIEAKINKMAAEGWKFEQFESIIGRCCLIFARYKAVICFSKEK